MYCRFFLSGYISFCMFWFFSLVTYFQKLKKFFGVLEIAQYEFFLFFLSNVIHALFPLATVWMIDQVMYGLEMWVDATELYSYLYILAWLIVVYRLYEFFWRNNDWMYDSTIRKYLRETYINKYVLLDANAVESIGTWRLISIIEKWISKRIDLIKITFREWIKNSVSLVFIVFYLVTYLPQSIVWVFVVAFLVCLFVWRVNRWAYFWRIKRREKIHDIVKKMVKILMSKFEILQNQKHFKEVEKIKELDDWRFAAHLWVVTYVRAIFVIPWLFVSLITFAFLWYWVILETWSGYAGLATIMMILTLLAKIIHDLVRFYRNFTMDWVHVEKLLDFFDETPDIVGYNSWNEFLYSRWNIELHSVWFGYTWWQELLSDFSLIFEWWKKTAWYEWVDQENLLWLNCLLDI